MVVAEERVLEEMWNVADSGQREVLMRTGNEGTQLKKVPGKKRIAKAVTELPRQHFAPREWHVSEILVKNQTDRLFCEGDTVASTTRKDSQVVPNRTCSQGWANLRFWSLTNHIAVYWQ